MHICKDALRPLYFKSMQGKSRFENSKRLFILPTLWRFFTDAQTDFFFFFLTIGKSYKFFRTSILYSKHSSSCIPFFIQQAFLGHSTWTRHWAEGKEARHLGAWDCVLWSHNTRLAYIASQLCHSVKELRASVPILTVLICLICEMVKIMVSS